MEFRRVLFRSSRLPLAMLPPETGQPPSGMQEPPALRCNEIRRGQRYGYISEEKAAIQPQRAFQEACFGRGGGDGGDRHDRQRGAVPGDADADRWNDRGSGGGELDLSEPGVGYAGAEQRRGGGAGRAAEKKAERQSLLRRG